MTLNSKELLAAAIALVLTYRRTGLVSSDPAFREVSLLQASPTASGIDLTLEARDSESCQPFKVSFNLKKQLFGCSPQSFDEAELVCSTIDWRYSLVKTAFGDWRSNVVDLHSMERHNFSVACALVSLMTEDLEVTLEYSEHEPQRVEKLWFKTAGMEGVLQADRLEETKVSIAYCGTGDASSVQEYIVPDVRSLLQ